MSTYTYLNVYVSINISIYSYVSVYTQYQVIMATNRADTLDPALLRPGRLDRKIEFPYPDRRQKRLVFTACTSKMNLSEEVDLEDYVNRPDKISAADISSICQEAGMMAVRRNRYVCTLLLYRIQYNTMIYYTIQ